MNNLLIRADATTEMGTGHIMRCLALAQAWQQHGGRATFLSHCNSDALRHHVESAGIDFVPLDKPYPAPADSQRTIALLSKLQAIWLVIDGYHFDQVYHQAVRKSGCQLLMIDDTAHLPVYHADILLNQNINAEQLPYLCDHHTKMLLGTRYALLRNEFLSWRDWNREIYQVARHVLVTLGGSDSDNATLKVIQAMQQADFSGLKTRIIVGSANPHLEILNHAVQNSTCNFQLLTDVPDMPEQMAWADIAISAGGTTCWELAFMGVPTIVLVLAENQRNVAEGLAQAGITINLGWFNQVSDGQILYALFRLLDNAEQRSQMSRAGRQLVDGNGRSRVMQSILDQRDKGGNGQLRIRLAEMSDAFPLWELANEPCTRMNAFNPDPILFAHHVEWLKRKLTSHDTRIWILELDGNIAAQIRYDRVDENTAEIDFTVAPALRGKGIGTKALALTRQTACAEMGVRYLVGVTFDSNLSSARSFVKAGFKLIAEGKQVRGQSCSIFKRNCEEAW